MMGLMTSSICVLTILRINSVQILDLTDVTSSCAPLALWTVLEPTLGVVNACLPVMRPALQKIFGSDAILWTLLSTRSSESKSSKGSKLLGSSFKGDNMVDAGRENDFQRLYDDRHTLAEQKNIVQAERIEKGSRGGGTGRMKQGSTAMGVIEVTNGWDVDSVKANTHDIV